ATAQLLAVYVDAHLRDVERIARFPSADFWLECDHGGYRYGWRPEVVDGDLLLVCFQLVTEQKLALPVGAIHWNTWSGNEFVCLVTKYGEAINDFDFDRLAKVMVFGVFLLSAMSSPRMVSVRRVVPSPAD
ncbi:hypothetical protein, partial [Mesorhizobium sp. M4B.F.Ca.ET.190.01.1.1]|uniref:hypothetical protein n=1 Tax=Mesorhizobium sp. M4B.F.Ca.ET.190.01.1.1 TaxID=2563951 RepID=UPI00167260F4